MRHAEEPDWRDYAKELYRLAQSELLGPSAGVSSDPAAEFLKEELRESLLDLKQAVIQGRAVAALAWADEVASLLAELRKRLGGKNENESEK